MTKELKNSVAETGIKPENHLMNRLIRTSMLFAIVVAGCSKGGGSLSLNADPVRASALQSEQRFVNYENLIIVPTEVLGDQERLFVFPDGINGNSAPSVHQVSWIDLPGLSPDNTALQFSTASKGEKVLALYESGSLKSAALLDKTSSVPVSKPEIPAELLPQIVISHYFGDTAPVAIPKIRFASDLLTRVEVFEANYPLDVQAQPVSQDFDLFRQIKTGTNWLENSEVEVIDQIDDTSLVAILKDKTDDNSDQLYFAANMADETEFFKFGNSVMLRLHPVLSRGSYATARKSQIAFDGVAVPPHSVVIFVRPAR